MSYLTLRSQSRCFGGKVAYYAHESDCCNSPMNFAVYLPPQAQSQRVPVLYYLSGLTCSEENFTVKAGAQRYAAELGILLVVPDTSPRNTGIAGEDESWELGSGAGFYVNATQTPWQKYYQMYDYVTEELPEIIEQNFPIESDKQSIFGHSMGGHGALTCALKNPGKYRSVSAFAPICAPIQSPWGENAFSTYLGEDRDLWKAYDATELVKKTQLPTEILIDQGTEDSFYQAGELMPEVLARACETAGQPLRLRLQDGYDHSYFMIASFMGDHLAHHAHYLNQ